MVSVSHGILIVIITESINIYVECKSIVHCFQTGC